jgi:nicotinate-nucleotide adenylyltransferase
MRIGVFGGTFDPVHLGHLILAERCRDAARLDQVRFVPTARPPHKPDRALTPFGQRVEMLALAIAGQPAFRIDDLEKDRPGPSFTADTLEALNAANPGIDWRLLIGSDTLHDLPQWHEPRRIVERAGLLIVRRPGHEATAVDALRVALGLPADAALRAEIVDAPLVDISSRELRRIASQGRSIRYQVPRAVECYIHDKGLYRT